MYEHEQIPSSSHRFIGRTEEIRAILDRTLPENSHELHSLQTIILLSGTKGIGKTAFLQELQRRCKNDGIPYMSINFDPTQNPNAERYMDLLDSFL